MRTALYLRASSRDQIKHGFSIPDQLSRLRAEAKAAGEQIVAEYIDQARSGASAIKRHDYQNLLAAARRREFDRVRVESVDRGHRNDLERREFENELQSLGIQVLYNGEPIKQAPQYRKFNRGIRGVVAELESDETSQRTYKRHLYRAKQGKWRGGPPPYGTLPDGQGWLRPDPASYRYLLWILEERGTGIGYHSIARRLNTGISIGGSEPVVPPTPGLLIYRRKPYLERQDPETGDVIRLPRAEPSTRWTKWRVQKICQQATEGIYGGVLLWGQTHNRFDEDADGQAKRTVRVETGKLLVPEELLQRVRVVELATSQNNSTTMSAHTKALLTLRCGRCGEAMHSYVSTKYKNGKAYKYRKYRCSGRVNKTGSCTMPIMGATALENAVLEALFVAERDRRDDIWFGELRAVAHARAVELGEAIEERAQQLAALQQRREEALDALLDRSLSPVLRNALAARAEELVHSYDNCEAEHRKLQAQRNILQAQLTMIQTIIDTPLLKPEHWSTEDGQQALKRAIHLLVHRMQLIEFERGKYIVEIWLYKAKSLLFRETGSYESACFF